MMCKNLLKNPKMSMKEKHVFLFAKMFTRRFFVYRQLVKSLESWGKTHCSVILTVM